MKKLSKAEIKRLGQQHYEEVYCSIVERGKKRLRQGAWLPEGMRYLESRAQSEAYHARIAYEADLVRRPELHPEAFGQITIPAELIFDKLKYKIPKRSPVDGIFSSIVKGENEKVFRLLEHTVNTMREQSATIPILLVGPPSVGKTMTAEIIARAVDRPFLPLSAGTLGSKLFKVVDGPLAQIHSGNPFQEVYAHPDNRMPVQRIKPTTIFIDEAHELHESVQTTLLVAMEKPFLVPKPDGGYLDFRDVLFLGGTTDPSAKRSAGLVKPLRTRFTEVTFVHYGVGSVAKIIRRHYPRISRPDSELLARTAKLYPRTALRYAKQAGSMPMGEFIREYLGADELGLDALDQRILALLEENQRPRNPVKVAEARFLLEQHSIGERVTPAQLARAKALVEVDQAKPIGISALAHKLMVTDLVDIQARVHYLETLGLAVRTSQGVIRGNRETSEKNKSPNSVNRQRLQHPQKDLPLEPEGGKPQKMIVVDPSYPEATGITIGVRQDRGRCRPNREPLSPEKQEILERALDSLGPKTEKKLRMRFGVGDECVEFALEEVGSEFSVTKNRIKKISEKAIKKILHKVKPTDPLFDTVMEMMDDLKCKDGINTGKIKIGTSLPVPVYEFMCLFPGKVRKFFQDAINDYDGNLEKLANAAADFIKIRRQMRETEKIRWVDGWLEASEYFLLNELDMRMTEMDGKKGSRALPGLLYLHLQRKFRENPNPPM